MGTSSVLVLVACIVGTDALIIPLVVGAVVDANWNPLAEKFPPMAPAPNVVSRSFQSFKVGVLNLGGCIHAAVDDSYLHLSPSWLARRMRAKAMSIPWSAMTAIEGRGRGRAVNIRDLGVTIRGPRWCLELAP